MGESKNSKKKQKTKSIKIVQEGALTQTKY